MSSLSHLHNLHDLSIVHRLQDDDTSPLAAGVESPWNLTLPGRCAKDPADHALFNAGFGNSVSLMYTCTGRRGAVD